MVRKRPTEASLFRGDYQGTEVLQLTLADRLFRKWAVYFSLPDPSSQIRRLMFVAAPSKMCCRIGSFTSPGWPIAFSAPAMRAPDPEDERCPPHETRLRTLPVALPRARRRRGW
jgi:hypothetical protein